MSGLNQYLWFALYTVLVWLASVITIVPAMLALWKPIGNDWRATASHALIRLLRRFTLALLLLSVSLLTNSHSKTALGQLGNSFDQIAVALPALYWLGIAGLLIGMAVMMLQVRRYRKTGQANGSIWWLAFGGNFLFLLFVTAALTMLSQPASSFDLPVGDFIARLSHIIGSALALFGMTMIFTTRSLPVDQTSERETIARTSLKWMLSGAALQLLTGTALLVVVGMKDFPVPLGHILMTFGILSAIGVLVMAALAGQKTGSILKLARSTAFTVLLTMFLMTGLRIAHLSHHAANAQAETTPVTIP